MTQRKMTAKDNYSTVINESSSKLQAPDWKSDNFYNIKEYYYQRLYSLSFCWEKKMMSLYILLGDNMFIKEMFEYMFYSL